ncbi:CCA tRNA nucleotidyltransferase [Sporosarcina sp. CAU 1771]
MTDVFTKGPGFEVLCELENAGYEAVFVGGAVRDRLLHKAAKDIDIATSAEPTEVKAVFSNTVDVGLAHGTILVVYKGHPIEVTTYRTEGTYTDHRRPDEVRYVKSLRNDLLRRDFTMNAIALTKDGELIDPHGGREDLENKRIRAVGNAEHRFQEDALRMLRAIRFASVLNFSIEEKTLQAICSYAEQIQHVSVERVKIEMDKLFLGSNPLQAFKYMEKTGLANHLPVFPNKVDHLVQAIPFSSEIEGWAYIVLEGGFSTGELIKSYKLSKSEGKLITSIQQLYEKRKIRSFVTEDYYFNSLVVLQATEKLFRAFNENCPVIKAEEIKLIKEELPIQSIADLMVSGHDLIQWSNSKAGKWTGDWIKKIEFAVLHQTCENDPMKIREWFLYEFNCEK